MWINKATKLFPFLILLPAIAYGYSPFVTDDAGTTVKHTFQIEQYFYSLLQVGQDSADAVSSGEDFQGLGDATAFPMTFAYGLSDRIELNFSPTYYLKPVGNFSRVTNYTLNLKWRLMGDGEKGLNLALKPSLIAPASTTQQEYGLGNALWNYGMTFIASQLSEKYELHFNTGYTRAPYNGNYMVGMVIDPNRTNLYSVSIAPVFKISDQIKVGFDTGFATNPNEPDHSLTAYGLVALIYSPTKDVDLGIAYQRNAANLGIAYGASGSYISRIQFGMTYRFN